MPINNPKIYDPNADLGHVDKMFRMLGGGLDNFVSNVHPLLLDIAIEIWLVI